MSPAVAFPGVIQRLSTCKWVTQHENVILCGPTGVGKTFVACALANQACRKGFSSMYRRVRGSCMS